MTVFSVRHVTVYRYARPVSFGEHRLMFRPRDSYDQRLLGTSLAVEPEPRDIRWILDVFGNCVALVRFSRPAALLRFDARIRLDHTPLASPDFRIADEALVYPFAYGEDDAPDLAPMIQCHYPDEKDEIGHWARQFLKSGGRSETGTLLMTLCYAIRESFAYVPRFEPGTQSPLQTLRLRRGTCRDFALFMMEAVRSLGFAARFVSGYIYVPGVPGSRANGGNSTHAWCEVYLPGAGWVAFDPTNGIVGNRDLIRVAVARDPRQAIPLSGTYEGYTSDHLEMRVQVNVHRAAEPVRPAAVLAPA